MVGMVGNQLTLFGQTRAIDTMRLENDDGEIGAHTNNHQRHKHTITTRQFGNQEDTCQRRMHHTRHHTSHTQQREILLWDIDAYLIHVPETGEQEARKASDKQRGSKRTTATATTISCRGGHHLRKQHQGDIGNQHRALSREQRIIQNLIPVCLRPSVQQ